MSNVAVVTPNNLGPEFDIGVSTPNKITITPYLTNNFARLDSPQLVGDPTAPTPPASSNNKQIATTEFVTSAVLAGEAAAVSEALAQVAANTTSPSQSLPIMDGVAATGSNIQYARADHIHPSDTSRVPITTSVNAGPGLAGGGALSNNLTLSFDTAWGDARYALAPNSAPPVQNSDLEINNTLQANAADGCYDFVFAGVYANGDRINWDFSVDGGATWYYMDFLSQNATPIGQFRRGILQVDSGNNVIRTSALFCDGQGQGEAARFIQFGAPFSGPIITRFINVSGQNKVFCKIMQFNKLY